SLRTLKGTYVYHCAGFRLDNGQQVHFAFAGEDHFDGNGTVTGVFSYSDNSPLLQQHISYSGTYTVNPDCTGTYTTVDENGVSGNLDLFFGRDGEEVTFIFTDPGVVDAGVERRVDKGDSQLPVVESNFNYNPQSFWLWYKFFRFLRV